MYDGLFLWNSIPKEIKESKSLSFFGTNLFPNELEKDIPFPK
jgi:hypothetical protein